MNLSEIQHDKDQQYENNDASHYKKGDAQELIRASQRIDFGQVDVLFAIKLIDFEFIIDDKYVCLPSRKCLPYVTPQLNKGWETFHLIPYHDMLICDVKPHDRVWVVNRGLLKLVISIDRVCDICLINRDSFSIRGSKRVSVVEEIFTDQSTWECDIVTSDGLLVQ